MFLFWHDFMNTTVRCLVYIVTKTVGDRTLQPLKHFGTGAEMSGQFGTGAKLSHGYFGTSVEV